MLLDIQAALGEGLCDSTESEADDGIFKSQCDS